MDATSKLNVAIVGAGISGLAFALALQRYAPDVAFEIYEGASQLSEIGAGVGIQPRTWAIVQALGLEDAMARISGDEAESTIAIVHRKSDQAEGVDINKTPLVEKTFSFHRAELQKVFLAHLNRPDAVRLGKRLLSYSQPAGPGRIELRFHDGTTATCDVLVGCDGIRSSVRAAMYSELAAAASAAGDERKAEVLRSYMPPRFSGAVVYRCMVRKDELPDEALAHPAFNSHAMIIYCGKNRHVVTYPISSGRVLNVGLGVVFPGTEGKPYDGPWTSSVSREEITKHFSGWEPDVQEIMKYVNGGIQWAIHVIDRVPTYVHGRVLFIGDAAHAMCPHLGAGAGQCFEDGWLLGQFLGHSLVTRENVTEALRVWDEIRRPFSQNIVALSRRSEQLHHLNTPELSHLTEEQSASGHGLTAEELEDIGRDMERIREWRDYSNILEENAAALRRLQDALFPAPA
ncbi:FAD/NAD(P)-binding domain-containing protein [Daedaleopsis nitida]|nr:FAD/NAD(P)-binding domain-containing protein [Daedaleopsis nitida]